GFALDRTAVLVATDGLIAARDGAATAGWVEVEGLAGSGGISAAVDLAGGGAFSAAGGGTTGVWFVGALVTSSAGVPGRSWNVGAARAARPATSIRNGRIRFTVFSRLMVWTEPAPAWARTFWDSSGNWPPGLCCRRAA